MRILDDDASVEDYARYLQVMHGFHAPLEPILGLVSERARAHMLVSDLVALGRTPGPLCDVLPVLPTPSHVVGATYVIEGSTLGGRFILAKLPPPIAAWRGRATRYLEGYGELTGVRWRAFGVEAEAVPVPEDAIAGARETFARLGAWLARFEAADGRRVAS